MKIENVIHCDSVRIERTGKPILVGVYLDDIQVLDFPVTFGLETWLQFYVDADGKTTIEFRFLKDRKPFIRGGTNFNVEDFRKSISMVIPAVLIEMDGPGTLSFQMREKGKKWRTLKKYPVRLKED